MAFGNFRITTEKGYIIDGKLDGTTNLGSHRKPVEDCEDCNRKGHMEGYLRGRIDDPNNEYGSFGELSCTYIINFTNS